MAHMKITQAQADKLMQGRSMLWSNRKRNRKEVMKEIRQQHPAIGNHKIVLFVENPSNPLYCVIRDKRTKLPLDDGKPDAVKAPAKAVKAPAKAVKAPAKAVKAPAKAVKAPAKAVKAPAQLGSPIKNARYHIEVRPSIKGKKVMLGYASSETMKAKMVALARG